MKSASGHRRRLRDRFTQDQPSGFQDYEILEFLLTFGVPRKDVKPQAKELMEKFGSLARVLEAPGKELEEVKGVGKASSFLLRLARESCVRYLRSRIEKKNLLKNAEEVVQYCRALLLGKDHEEVWVLYLNIRNEIMGQEAIALGTLDQAQVYPRRIVEGCLRTKAAGLIMAHNHPSGKVDPSAEDEALTAKVFQALKTVDLRLVDHIIVGSEGFFSFRQSGVLK